MALTLQPCVGDDATVLAGNADPDPRRDASSAKKPRECQSFRQTSCPDGAVAGGNLHQPCDPLNIRLDVRVGRIIRFRTDAFTEGAYPVEGERVENQADEQEYGPSLTEKQTV
jgi:hypothetical protein